jgi:hypothetical protein
MKYKMMVFPDILLYTNTEIIVLDTCHDFLHCVLSLIQVLATAISLEKLFHSLPYGSSLETIEISGNDLMPSNKQKKEKIGYSPKNLKKKLLSYSPVFSSAMKSISVAVSAQLQTVGDMLDTKKSMSGMELSKGKQNNKKKSKLKSKIISKSNTKKKNLSKCSKNNLESVGKKILKKKIMKKKLSQKIEPKTTVDDGMSEKKSKRRLSTTITKNIILSEDKLLEKSRMKVVRGLLHALKMARNLKKIGLVKVGLTDFSCVLLKKEFARKQIITKNTEEKGKILSNENPIIFANKMKAMRKKFEKSSSALDSPKVSLSPQMSIPSEPELITNLDTASYSQNEADIDSSIYRHLRPDERVNDDSLSQADYRLATEMLLEEVSDGNGSASDLGRRNIIVSVSMNSLSPQSVLDITEIVQLS